MKTNKNNYNYKLIIKKKETEYEIKVNVDDFGMTGDSWNNDKF